MNLQLPDGWQGGAEDILRGVLTDALPPQTILDTINESLHTMGGISTGIGGILALLWAIYRGILMGRDRISITRKVPPA